jgi:hypothetical protein
MLQRSSLGLSLAALALATASPVAAQVCLGGPALGVATSANVGGSVSFFDGGKTYGVSAAFGSEFFGSGGFSYTDLDDTELSLKTLSVGAGYQVAPESSEVSVCPTLGFAYSFGLEFAGIDITALSITPAVAIGVDAEISPTVSLMPFAQLGLVYNRVTADAGIVGDATESETNGLLVLGAGLNFNERVAIGPAVYIPLASDGGDTVFGVGVSVAVGGSD